MVRISVSAVRIRKLKPAAPRLLAWAANWVMYSSTWRAMVMGIRLSISQRSSTRCMRANTGNAVNTASATVAKGTSASSVVKVRLAAVRPRRSSR